MNESILSVYLNYDEAIDYFISYFISLIEPFIKVDVFDDGRFVSPGAPRSGWIGIRLTM